MATEDYTQALRINPTNGTALFLRGSVYFNSNEPDKGRKDFELLIETAPEYDNLRVLALKKLESLNI